MPKTQPNDEELMEGGFEDELDEEEAEDEQPSKPDPLVAIQAQLDALKQENERLRRAIPPVTAAAPAAPPPEVDWDKLLFENPKEALRIHGEQVGKDVEKRLTERYQRDQGTQRFWTDFYAKHADLKSDGDLVQATLEANFEALASLPVDKAIDRVAQLTRDRISRYSKKATRKTPQVEGAGSPMPRPTSPTTLADAIPKSLSDSIRRRRAARGIA